MDLSERFWLGLWALVATVLVAGIFAVWDCHRRDQEFDAKAPVVETCVHHNVRQKVVVQ